MQEAGTRERRPDIEAAAPPARRNAGGTAVEEAGARRSGEAPRPWRLMSDDPTSINPIPAAVPAEPRPVRSLKLSHGAVGGAARRRPW